MTFRIETPSESRSYKAVYAIMQQLVRSGVIPTNI
nr:MAG TPA: Protein of unknown function (DUF2922) [Caudoviricetes sp.]